MTVTQRSIIQPTDTDLLLGSIVREFAPPAPTLKEAMFKSKVVEVSWDPRSRAEASAWQQWDGRVVNKGVAKPGSWPAAVRTSSPSPFGTVTVKRTTFEALAELMAAADAIPRDSSRRRNYGRN